MALTNGAATAHASSDEQPLTIYELELQDDGSPSKQRSYIRLPPPVVPYVLRISLNAGSLASKAGVLFTNFPLDGSAFDREKFHQRNLPTDFSKPIKIDLPITSAGVFHYYIEYEASVSHQDDQPLVNGSGKAAAKATKRLRSSMGAFNVDPILTVPKRSSILSESAEPLGTEQGGGTITQETINLPLDGLVIQSVIAKWMGTIDKWDKHLDNTRDRGYNMFHFTPLQQRGDSGSPYSIYDQMAFDDELFANGAKMTVAQKQKGVKELLAKIRKTWGILSMTDVVWNHTANNSLWLEDHPESGYNVVNSPHLESALELDNALLEFSRSLEKLGLATELKEWNDLLKIMDHLENKVIPSLNLWQYYVIDVESEKSRFSKAWGSAKSSKSAQIPEDLSSMSREDVIQLFAARCMIKGWNNLGSRYHAKVADSDLAVAFVTKMLGSSDKSAEQATQALGQILNDLNVARYALYNDDVKAILENTKGRIDYTRLAGHGPKMGKITEK